MSDTTSSSAQNSSTTPSAWTAVLLSSFALALTLTGDQLLYVVLPLEAAGFGVTLVWVGILLSANRWIRVLLYGEVSRLGNRLGARRTTLVASIGAVGSTLMYAVCDGGALLLAARILWGLSFAALNLTTLVYAVTASGAAGRMMGTSRSVRQLGPALAAAVGGWLAASFGPRDAFLAMTALTAIALPLAWLLPRADPMEAQARPPARGWRNLMPSPFNLFTFAVVLTGDGVFTVTVGLLFREEATTQAALLSAGLAVAARNLVVILVGPVGGAIADRFGTRRTMVVATLAIVLGFALIPAGALLPGVALILLARGVLSVVTPVLVAEQIRALKGGNAMHALSANATWGDLGAAIGPLLAGFSIGVISLDTLYGAMAVLLALLFGVWLALERRAG